MAHRCATICKDRESRTQETRHLKKVLSVSRYTKKAWKMATGSHLRIRSSKPVSSGSARKGSVVIPYVGQVSNQIAQLFCSRGMMTHICPYKNTIRACLVRHKDRLSVEEQADLVFSIKCADCPASYVGETDRETPGKTAQGTPMPQILDRITTVSAWGVRCQQALGHPAQRL